MRSLFFDDIRNRNPNLAKASDYEIEQMLSSKYGNTQLESMIQKYLETIKPPSIQKAVTQKIKKDSTGIDALAEQAKAQAVYTPYKAPQQTTGERITEAITPIANKVQDMQNRVMDQFGTDEKQAGVSIWDTAADYLPTPNTQWTPSTPGITPFSKVGDAVREALKRKKEAEAGYNTIQGQ